MTKFFVKLGLRGLNIAALVALARLIVTKMGLLPPLVITPDPPLADITTAANKAEASAARVAAAKSTLAQEVATQDTDEKSLQDLLTAEGRTVDNKAKGDKAFIESCGMPASDTPSPVGELPRVENLSLTHGDNPGEVDAHWNRVKKSRNYTVQITADPIGSAPWTTKVTPTKSSVTITGQTSGTKVWVQVCANGTAGAAPFSDPAVIVVP
ncbi:MAG TPA: hypothetical protein VI757_13355 [Bacteroidia bacterium]|nr:hypothetical protein [Bacteroidia bacterium]